jgi:anti-anti-sigma factor
MLKVEIQSAPPAVALLCAGRIVLGVEAETLRCMTTARQERHVLLEFSRVNAIDAAGLGLLVALHRWAEDRSMHLIIANPSMQAQRIIALTNLDRVLNLTGMESDEVAGGHFQRWNVMTA